MISFNVLVSVLAVVGPAQSLRYIGRVNPATKELTWSRTGVSFTFSGTSASIEFRLNGTNSAEFIVDGKSTYIPNVNGTSISTQADLKYGRHTVEFLKSSEALLGSIFIGDIRTNGHIEPDIPASKRRIELIGDSITSGYGVGGIFPCNNTAAVEIISQTYGALTASAVKADINIISWSGIGIVRNFFDEVMNPIMPVRYTKYGAHDANNSYTFPEEDIPAAVVINLGTNDFSQDGPRPQLNVAEYIAAVVKFVHFVQSSYHSELSFFLLSSPMLGDNPTDMAKTTQINALKEVVLQLNDTKAYFVDWPTQGSDLGCDAHPTPRTHAIGAKVLTEALRTTLNW